MKKVMGNVTRVGTLAFRAIWCWEKKWTEGARRAEGKKELEGSIVTRGL